MGFSDRFIFQIFRESHIKTRIFFELDDQKNEKNTLSVQFMDLKRTQVRTQQL